MLLLLLFKESMLYQFNSQPTFDRDEKFRAVGGEDACFVEDVGGGAHVGAAVLRRRSEEDR